MKFEFAANFISPPPTSINGVDRSLNYGLWWTENGIKLINTGDIFFLRLLKFTDLL